MFADKVEVEVKAGKGGDGRLSFRHEKFRARGGPDGGDGGHGGSVIFEVDHNLHTLVGFRKQRVVKAEAGDPGGSDRKHGKKGTDTVVKVPVGTQVFEDGLLSADLTRDSEQTVIAKGGRGGFGNAHFTSSTRQAPRATELGEPGEQRHLTLELKLVADVGLVGLPNAGKSTLLSVISNAKPEIGDYPFTTLTPNLGVVDFRDIGFLAADIPGLIEGASKGKGLGDEFLRHIERTAVLIHLIDAYSEDLIASYETIQNELRSYAVDLTDKPQLIALTKVEGIDPKRLKSLQQKVKKATGSEPLAISAQAGVGIDKLLAKVAPMIRKARDEAKKPEKEAPMPVIDLSTQPDLWQVIRDGAIFVVAGQSLERFATRTDWNNDASVERLRDILRKQGVGRELARLGAAAGDIVKIGGHELEWL